MDWHCLADGGRDDIFDLTVALAEEFGPAVRAWLEVPGERHREVDGERGPDNDAGTGRTRLVRTDLASVLALLSSRGHRADTRPVRGACRLR